MNKISPTASLICIAAGIICGKGYHSAFVQATYDTSHSWQAGSIPLIMFAAGFIGILMTIRGKFYGLFPIPLAAFSFGLAALVF